MVLITFFPTLVLKRSGKRKFFFSFHFPRVDVVCECLWNSKRTSKISLFSLLMLMGLEVVYWWHFQWTFVDWRRRCFCHGIYRHHDKQNTMIFIFNLCNSTLKSRYKKLIARWRRKSKKNIAWKISKEILFFFFNIVKSEF